MLAIALNVLVAWGISPVARADHGGVHVELQADTHGCIGVLPSNDGNTDMQLVGGSLSPGGTAVFEITYPVDPGDTGKEFQIRDCAFINGEPALKYVVDFVPSNQYFVLVMELAVPTNAPIGGEYCNYAKTTRSPTASQGSQRKAGPACFIIQPPGGPGTSVPGAPGTGGPPGSPSTTFPGPGGVVPLLPNTAVEEAAVPMWMGLALGFLSLAFGARALASVPRRH